MNLEEFDCLKLPIRTPWLILVLVVTIPTIIIFGNPIYYILAHYMLNLIIQNTKTGQKAGLLGSQVMSELKPNESKTIQWDQRDINGKQV